MMMMDDDESCCLLFTCGFDLLVPCGSFWARSLGHEYISQEL